VGVALLDPMVFWDADEGVVAPAGVHDTGTLLMSKFINGDLVGSVRSDVAGSSLVIVQERVLGDGDLSFNIPVDATQPAFTFPFQLKILLPFVTLRYTNGGGGATTFLRAKATAIPLQ